MDSTIIVTASVRFVSRTDGPQGQLISYAYNPDGSRLQMGSPAGIYSYQYDGIGRLTRAGFPWTGGAATHTYLPNGWLKTTKTNRFLTTYGYNARGLVNLLTNANTVTSTTVSDFTGMTYDAAGNRLGLTAFIPAQGKAPSASRTQTFAYDEAGQRDVLLSEISAGGGSYSENYTNRFAYDPAYNPTQMRSGALIPYNRDNQRTGTGFRHDGNGNPVDYAGGTFAAGTAFSYDAENRLTQIVSPSPAQNLSAGYGYDNLRVWRETPIQGKLFFLYDETGFSQTPLLEGVMNIFHPKVVFLVWKTHQNSRNATLPMWKMPNGASSLPIWR